MNYFEAVPKIQYEGKQTKNKFAFRYYNPEEEILGKQLRLTAPIHSVQVLTKEIGKATTQWKRLKTVWRLSLKF